MKRRKQGIFLALLLLLAIAMLPPVSASGPVSSDQQINLSKGSQRLELHNLNSDNVPIAKPMTESDLITIIVPASMITDAKSLDDNSILNISMLSLTSDELFYSQENFSNSRIFKGMRTEEPIAVLRVPDYIFRALINA